MIDHYFQSVLDLVSASLLVRSSDITLDKRSQVIGFIRGNIYFVDDSLLHYRELVDFRLVSGRVRYVYHYQRGDGKIIFRYDNTDHFPDLPNFPHHKHVGDETNVVSAEPPDLAAVLKEVESLIAVE